MDTAAVVDLARHTLYITMLVSLPLAGHRPGRWPSNRHLSGCHVNQ